jgi:hypothetical protein
LNKRTQISQGGLNCRQRVLLVIRWGIRCTNCNVLTQRTPVALLLVTTGHTDVQPKARGNSRGVRAVQIYVRLLGGSGGMISGPSASLWRGLKATNLAAALPVLHMHFRVKASEEYLSDALFLISNLLLLQVLEVHDLLMLSCSPVCCFSLPSFYISSNSFAALHTMPGC